MAGGAIARRPAGGQASFLPNLEACQAERRALVRGALATLSLRSDLARGLEALVLYLSACGADEPAGCRARQAIMAEQLGIDRRTVQRQLALLCEAGFLAIESSLRDRAGGRGANSMRLDWASIRAAAVVGEKCRSAATLQAFKNVAAPGQNVAAPGQNVAPLTNEYRFLVLGTSIKSTTTPTPPPVGSDCLATADRNGPSPELAAAAGDVARELAQCGVAHAGAVARELLASGMATDRLRTIVGWWRAQRGAYGPGALVARLRADWPEATLDSGWPLPARHGAATDAARDAALAARQSQSAADRLRADSERLTAQALEAEHGEQLDRLAPDCRRELAERALTPAERTMFARDLRAERIENPYVRRRLLEALAAHARDQSGGAGM